MARYQMIRLCLVACAALLSHSAAQANQPLAQSQVHHSVQSEQGNSTSFETAPAGPFVKLQTEIGTWTSVDGSTIIDDKHAKTGKQCLQLMGGEKTSVVLEIAEGISTTGHLTFWAERWTSRAPFSFRIESYNGKDWKEVFNGDSEVRVGRAFLCDVKVPLGDNTIQQLRFTVTSPAETGVLIDDIRIAPFEPQRIVSVDVVPFCLPALVGNRASPLLKLKVETTGQLNPISLTDLQATLDGTSDIEDVVSLSVHNAGSGSDVASGKQVATLDVKGLGNKPAVFSCPEKSCLLSEGTNTIWVVCELSENANIDHRVGAKCQQATFSNGESFKFNTEPSIQRIGVALRNGGDDGVHTYRIPGLATTNKGTLIGVYDVRRRSGGDLPGDIDVGMSRSIDGGRTWESMKIVMDMGDDPNWKYDGIGDPAVLVDQSTGTIWIAATWSHGNRSWIGSGPGLTPEETGQLMLVRSDDDGVTWSEPINITHQVKNPDWCFILQGPGKGITMSDGTIVFAAQYQDPPNATDKAAHRLPHSTIIYSKDHGITWHVGTGAFDDTTESQVVEIEPGLLMLNCRYNRKATRVVMTTRDMGQTWQQHPTSERALIEPGSCMASLINVDPEVGKGIGSWLLFSNPDSTSGRDHITIKGSSDRGLTWPKERQLLLDEGDSAGYSCMSMIDEKTVGILYEGSQAHMSFQRISLTDIVSKSRPVAVSEPSSLRLPPVFSSHMVLQADAELPVWGWAEPVAKVSVTFGGKTLSTNADQHGTWQVRFPPRPASTTPTELSITSDKHRSDKHRIVLTDILIGEVWVCAGQSNMEWPLKQSANGDEELSAADHPHLRLLHLIAGAGGNSGSYTVDQLARLTSETYFQGEWKVASTESAQRFSAVAWHFGRDLQRQLNVPVGLICPAVGGTPAEAWIPREALEADSELKGLVAGNWLDNHRLGEFCRTRAQNNLLEAIQSGETIPGDELGPNHPFKPGFMWEVGIKPLTPFAIRGVIWYQGESNAETLTRVREHHRLFPLLINQWRLHWGQGDFPFLYVQLPASSRPEWPLFRDGQRRILDQLHNVGMAVTIDTGDPTDVHPTVKKPVGERLAKWALGTTYHSQTNANYSGPLLESAERRGNSILVSFRHVDAGLKSFDDQPLRHFEISDKDGVFHPANAKIVDKATVAVSSPLVTEPENVRYAWLPYADPSVNLFNSDNLPASPFSTESDERLFSH